MSNHYVLDEASFDEETELYIALYQAEEEDSIADEIVCICVTALMVGLMFWWWFCA